MVENCVGGYNSCMFAYGQVSPSANLCQKYFAANCFDYCTLILFHNTIYEVKARSFWATSPVPLAWPVKCLMFMYELLSEKAILSNIFILASLMASVFFPQVVSEMLCFHWQTGSGKTHTMLGDIEAGTRRHSINCGMTPRVFEYLFSRIQKVFSP